MGGGRNGGKGAFVAWRDAELAAERSQRDADARQELGASVGEARDAQRRVGKIVGEQSETRNAGRPSPVGRREVDQLDFQGVSWFRFLNADGSVDLVDTREV